MRNLICVLQPFESPIMEEQAAAIASFYRGTIASTTDTVLHFGSNTDGTYFPDYKGVKELYVNFNSVFTPFAVMCRKAIEIARKEGYSHVSIASCDSIIYKEGYDNFIENMEKGGFFWGFPFGQQSLLTHSSPEILDGLLNAKQPPPNKLFLYGPDSMKQGIFITFSTKCADGSLFKDRLVGDKAEIALSCELSDKYGKALRQDGPVTRIKNAAFLFVSEKEQLHSDLVFYRLYGDESNMCEEHFKTI